MSSATANGLDLQHLARSLAASTDVAERQVLTAIELLEDGNTLPFIARYWSALVVWDLLQQLSAYYRPLGPERELDGCYQRACDAGT